jgi:hypothetical protein
MAAWALDHAVVGTTALCTGAPEAREERAQELEKLQALSLFLSQCLSAKAENRMVRNNQLPKWRQSSLSRLPNLYTADRVPNSEKMEGKWRSLRDAEEGDASEQCVIADLYLSGYLQHLRIKLVPFVRHTDSGPAYTLGNLGNLAPRQLT